MRIGTVLNRSAWVLAIWLVLVSQAMAGPEANDWEKNVPTDLRELVTKKHYDEIYTALKVEGSDLLGEEMIVQIASSPCGRALSDLVYEYRANSTVPAALNAVLAGLQDPPPVYGIVNPWKGAANSDELLRLMLTNFHEWCVFLPEINGVHDNALGNIQGFAWFYYQNEAGRDFVQGRNPLKKGETLKTGLDFVEGFSNQRGAYMSSPASAKYVSQWVDDPRLEIKDFKKTLASEYTSFNDFFSREIKTDPGSKTIPSRPASMPDLDYIVVSPTDCVMNPLVQVLVEDSTVVRKYVENPLQYDTVLDVKGIPISLAELLKGVPKEIRDKFVGGNGLACVLLPNTYHHFHAPVNGKVVHAEVLKHYGTYGYSDWPNWVPADQNIGRPGTDFSQFQAFERGVIVTEVKYANVPKTIDGKPPQETELTGYVASIPVGLDTIGSVQLTKGLKGQTVKRGYTEFGYFLYGGSLDILLFSKDLATAAVQTRLGNQVAIFNIGETPK